VAVPLQDEPRVTMPKLLCNYMRRRPRRDHQRRIGVTKIMERQPVELGASDRWPEHPSHEVVLPPHSTGRRREHEIKWPALTQRQLLDRGLCRHNSQVDNTLSTGLRLSKSASTTRPLNSHNPVRKVKVASTQTEHLALA